MKYYSVKTLKSAISILAISTALVNINVASAKNLKSITYTASGTTSLQNAKLFKQLMGNTPNIEIQTQFARTSKRSSGISKSYTIRGKTTKSNVRKLIQLFKNNQQIELIAESNQNAFKISSDYYYTQYQSPYFYSNTWTSMYKTPYNFVQTATPLLIAAK